MAGGIGVFSAESRAKGVNLTESRRSKFTFKLTGDSESGCLSEEILSIVHLTVVGLWEIVKVKGRDLEHSTRTLAVARSNKRSM